MKATSFSEFRRNLSATMDAVAESHEPVLVTRGKGKPPAVVISLEDFASYEETSYLLRSPVNSERLLTAVKELDAGNGQERSLVK